MAANLCTGSGLSGCLESWRMATHQDSINSADGAKPSALLADVADGAGESVTVTLQGLLKFNSSTSGRS